MNLITQITNVFSEIGMWIVERLDSLQSLFWIVEEQDDRVRLTFLGVLAVMGLGISVIFLLIRVIQNFLHFRG